MPFDPNDPRLTAYALGELDDTETATVEAILADSDDARGFVDEVRSMASLLTGELRTESAPGLSAEQRHVIEGCLTAPADSPSARHGRARWFGYAAAASLVVATGVLTFRAVNPEKERSARPTVVSETAADTPKDETLVALNTPTGSSIEGMKTDANASSLRSTHGDASYIRGEHRTTTYAPVATAPAVDDHSLGLRRAESESDANASRFGIMAPTDNKQLAQTGVPSLPQSESPQKAKAEPGYATRGAGDIGSGMEGMTAALPASKHLYDDFTPRSESARVAPGLSGITNSGPPQDSQGDSLGRGRQSGKKSGEPPSPAAEPASGPSPAPDTPQLLARSSRLDTNAMDKYRESAPHSGDGKPMSEPEGFDVSNNRLGESVDKQSQARTRRFSIERFQRDGTDFDTSGVTKARKKLPNPAKPDSSERSNGKNPNVTTFNGGHGQAVQNVESLATAAKPAASAMEKAKTLNFSKPIAPAQLAQDLGFQAKIQKRVPTGSEAGKPVAGELKEVEQKATVALAVKDAESKLPESLIPPPPPPAPVREAENAEVFAPINENPFERVTEQPQPTLSIDVDTASYANVRRFLNHDQLPPADAVRIEEMINYFRYDDPEPKGDDPFSVNVEIARCPWNVDHRIARIGLKGKSIDVAHRPMSNLVFLVDVSGSMMDANKLPLLKQSMKMLVETLGENDRVAMVVYAGSEGLALPSTSGERKEVILSALEQLQAGGSTNGGAGISLAYQIATQNFIKGGVNRVILCTDGDFNVGITDRGQLDKLIEEKAKSKVFLSVLGFGEGNLKDATMESLADKGNGNYSYIDSPKEGRKVLVDEAGSTLVTIAKDVKVQVEFNPSHVAAYRLIGYENRVMAAQDFNNDQKDAGEIGAGHNVTVLFELVPPGKELAAAGPAADDLVFQKKTPIPADVSKLAMLVKLRYKQPEGDVSKLISQGVEDTGKDYATASNDLKFSSAVASFGMLLRHSAYKGSATYDAVLELAEASKGEDKTGYRAEFLNLVRKAKDLSGPSR